MPNQFFSPEGDIENYYITEYWLLDQYLGNKMWNWGLNTSGQLGINTSTGSRSTPVTILNSVHNWKQVSAANSNVIAIKTDGSLWTWGNNQFGQLGINNTINRSTPVTTIIGGFDWEVCSAGRERSIAIKTDGSLWTWGNNPDGRLGINRPVGANVLTPTLIFGGESGWKHVSAGSRHTAAIKTDGSLWTWGYNYNGELGIGDVGTGAVTNRSTPVTTMVGGNDWKQVSCGEASTAAIKTNGSLWTWGSNAYGELGLGDNISRNTPSTSLNATSDWLKVSAGRLSMSAIKFDGSLWSWGLNFSLGTLGIGADATLIIRNTPVTTILGGNDWKNISLSKDPNPAYVSAIKTDGSLWVWGVNSNGQLGINNTNTIFTPVTTTIGGYNWKQSSCGGLIHCAITYGL